MWVLLMTDNAFIVFYYILSHFIETRVYSDSFKCNDRDAVTMSVEC